MSHSKFSLAAACVVASAAVLPGCYVGAVAEPEYAEPAYVEADYVPATVEVYPQAYYEGHVVYLVNGHWYTHDRGRWVYYRHEPPALYRQRLYVQHAPPARRAPAYSTYRYERRLAPRAVERSRAPASIGRRAARPAERTE